MAMQRLKEVAEKTKKELSSKTQCDVNLPFFSATAAGPQHLDVKLTRAKFERLIEDIVANRLSHCMHSLLGHTLEPAGSKLPAPCIIYVLEHGLLLKSGLKKLGQGKPFRQSHVTVNHSTTWGVGGLPSHPA